MGCVDRHRGREIVSSGDKRKRERGGERGCIDGREEGGRERNRGKEERRQKGEPAMTRQIQK